VARAQALLAAPYDLQAGPLCRFVVIRLSDDQHLLGLGTHHTISDVWSYGVIARDLALAYRGEELRPPVVSYRDYATWQREWLTGDALDVQVEFWRRTLHDLSTLDLVTDRPRPVF